MSGRERTGAQNLALSSKRRALERAARVIGGADSNAVVHHNVQFDAADIVADRNVGIWKI